MFCQKKKKNVHGFVTNFNEILNIESQYLSLIFYQESTNSNTLQYQQHAPQVHQCSISNQWEVEQSTITTNTSQNKINDK